MFRVVDFGTAAGARPAHIPAPRIVAVGAALIVFYAATAQLGFTLAVAAEQVTTVWAPTGLALAALLLFGLRLWPAIWLGAFIANVSTAAPLWTAFVIASGNTAEAVAAVAVLRRLPDFDVTLGRVADVLRFLFIAALVSTAISATVGVTTLCASGTQAWDHFRSLWFDWWFGDMLGAIIVAPAILTSARAKWSRHHLTRGVIFVAGAGLLSHVVFGQLLGFRSHPLEYAVFPVVIAAAASGGLAITALVVLSASAVGLLHTVRGAGPFAGPELHQSLILLQVFMGVLATTALFLAAAMNERRVSEDRERDAAMMLRLAQRGGGVGTFVWDFRHQIAHCSAEYFHIFGLPARDGKMAGAEWARFVHPDDRERMHTHIARALEGSEPATADYRIITADGAIRWLSYAGQFHRTADGDRLLGTVADISDRKQLGARLRHQVEEVERTIMARLEADNALRESRDVLSLAMRAGAMGAWSRDLTTNAVWWSAELEAIFGLPAGAFNRTEAGFFDFVHRDDCEAVRQAVESAVADQSDYVVEFRFQHADGSWRWMEGRGRALYADGRPQTLYGIGIDVTERKHAEERYAQLYQEAERANRLKDEFLATLSHELRTPLNAVLGWSHMLREGAMEPAMHERALASLERNAKAQAQLVEDLLDVSRIMAGKLRIKSETVDLGAVVMNAVDTVRAGVNAKRLNLRIHAPADRRMIVTGDPDRLQQVVWNLVSNAVKFTPSGGNVDVSLDLVDSRAAITVADSGPGIDASFLPHLFQRFRQMDASKTRAHGGLGLGLSIVKHLVEAHGGTVTADSAGAGKGATFRVLLPLRSVDDVEIGSSPHSVGALEPVLAGIRTLVVDDEADSRDVTRYVLESRGAIVATAASAGEALLLLAQSRYDTLIADIGMPEQDGLALIRAIRGLPEHSPNRAIAAIALTAYTAVRDRDEALAAGFNAYLAKPVNPDQLIAAVSMRPA